MNLDIAYVFIYSYFLGSIPFGLIITKFFLGKDIRNIGSGNIGTTNVLRTGKKSLAAATLILDILKGYISIFIAHKYFSELIYLSALICFIGHIFPLWLKFKGGKGVATYVGILFAINIYFGIIFALCWFIIFGITKFSSLSSLIASISIPVYLIITSNFDEIFFFIIMFVLIFFTHRENIKRLKNKEETKTKIY